MNVMVGIVAVAKFHRLGDYHAHNMRFVEAALLVNDSSL
jgi:hypothetical protein